MRKVKIKNLRLIDFRGAKDVKISFDDKETFIYGENGTGKSTIYDAFLWLLFGKDAQDRKDFELKRIENRRQLRKVDVIVEGEFNIDGEEVFLKRVFSEDWVKPRGATEQIFKGNHTDYFYNNVPVSMKEYQERISNIVEESLFKLITNPSYFATMKWQEQREQLLQLAGTISDEEIAKTNPYFSILLDKISGKSLADFKRELSARKKRLKTNLEEIQPRIDQTQRLMPEMTDFATLEEEVARIEAEIEKVDKAMNDATERVRQQYEAVQERQSKINALKSQRQQVLFDAQSKAKEDAFNANSNRRELEEQINVVKRKIHGYVQDEVSANNELANLHKRMQYLVTESNTLRSDWYKENEAQFNGETTCRCCGQELPESMKTEALAYFNQNKQARLNEITRNGKLFKEEIEDIKQRISEVEQDKNNAISGAKVKEEELHDLEEQLATLSEVKQVEIIPDNIKEYSDLTKQIADLEATLEAGTEKVNTSEYQARKKELSRNRDEVKAKLADRERIEQFKKQIADLEAKGKDLAQQIADLEQEEYVIQQVNKTKIEECEKRVNSLFSFVTFRLFDYTNDGNEYETCIPLVDGVPYPVANTAKQVNAGLDIINALCRFYNVSAPIFIDGRERVNEIIDTESQIINLSVSKDKVLTIK